MESRAVPKNFFIHHFFFPPSIPPIQAYISCGPDGVKVCTVVGEELSNCIPAVAGSMGPLSSNLWFDSSGEWVYLVYLSDLYRCAVNADGTFSNCLRGSFNTAAVTRGFDILAGGGWF